MSVLTKTRPWYMTNTSRIGTNPFTSIGQDWCPRCQQVVDCDSEAEYEDHTYAYRRVCRRCGKVTSYGVYDNVPTVGHDGSRARAVHWTMTPGRDRR